MRSFFARSLLLILGCLGFAHADLRSAQATALYPALTDLRLETGVSTTTRIFVGRDEPGVGEYTVSVLPFRPSSNGRSIEWLTEADARLLRTRTVVSEQAFRLLEGEAKVIDVTMTSATSTAQLGNEFIGVFISSQQGSTGAVGTRLASLFFISFANEVRPRFVVTDLRMETESFWRPSNVRTATITIQNQGTGYGIPQAVLLTRNLFGKIVTQTSVNSAQNRILAGESKTFQVRWKTPWFGRYTTSFEDSAIEWTGGTMTWWVFPWSVRMIVFCVLFGGVFFLIRGYRAR